MNVVFCARALMKARYNHLSKIAWLVVSLAESYNHNHYMTSVIIERDYTLRLPNLIPSLSIDSSNESNIERMNIDFVYHSYRAVTPHSRLLWGRIIENQDKILNSFKCKLYGIFKLDYGNVPRFNYCIVSFILLSAL